VLLHAWRPSRVAPVQCTSVFTILEEMLKPPATRLAGLRRSGPQFLLGVEVEAAPAEMQSYVQMRKRVDYGVDHTI